MFAVNTICGQVLTEQISDGIYKVSLGKDSFTPFELVSQNNALSRNVGVPTKKAPFKLEDIQVVKDERGVKIAVPLGDEEKLYGFGLQIGSFEQRGLKKKPIVNDYPLNTLGYTHAPQPFYVSTAGYGIVVNTSRYTTFLCGTNNLKQKQDANTDVNAKIKFNTSELYENKSSGNYVFIDVEGAPGVEIFIITGENITNVVQRYNLLSGGGCLPPLWGLGLKYRVKSDFNESNVENIANYFRVNNIPCDVIGLEPGWQTHAYSCSFVWENNRFPDPKRMIKSLSNSGFRVNLWEHAYTHPSSPLYKSLYDYSGDFLVWNGIVPDFANAQASHIFADYHKIFLDIGISGFKLDECDNSNIGKGDANWGFPDITQFPSGIDGEKMHQLFGSLYLKSLHELYKQNNNRTYFDYRSSGLFTSSYAATLYSDTYDRKEYIEMVANSGFSGLLWSPELRESRSETELLRRLQLSLMSAQAVVNGWYLSIPPWLQYDVNLNNSGVGHEKANYLEDCVRSLVNMRISLIPYLYSAFYDYYLKGIPPFRALVSDYSDDFNVYSISNQFLIGNGLMATPLGDDMNIRIVYFPEGEWYDIYSNKKYKGKNTYTIEFALDKLPLFVKSGTILPMAEPIQNISEDTIFNITCHVFDDNPIPFTLYADDGISFDYEKGNYDKIELSVNKNKGRVNTKIGKRYKIKAWKFIK